MADVALETWDAIRQQTTVVERLAESVDMLRDVIVAGLQINALPELPVPVVQAPSPLVVPAPQVTVEPSVVDLTPLYELLDRPTNDEQTVLLLRQMLGQLEQIPKSQIATWSGGITDAQLRASAVPVSNTHLANLTGTWAYKAAASGTITVPAGGRVLGIVAHATTAATLSINGGDSIPVPANVGIEVEPVGNLVAPSIVATGTDVVFVEYVS